MWLIFRQICIHIYMYTSPLMVIFTNPSLILTLQPKISRNYRPSTRFTFKRQLLLRLQTLMMAVPSTGQLTYFHNYLGVVLMSWWPASYCDHQLPSYKLCVLQVPQKFGPRSFNLFGRQAAVDGHDTYIVVVCSSIIAGFQPHFNGLVVHTWSGEEADLT